MDDCLQENEIVDLVAGTLDPEAARDAEAHIDACAACRLVLIELARVFDLHNSAGAEMVSDDAMSCDASAPSDAPLGLMLSVPALARGSTVGRYVILEFLGSGAMGVVFSAYDPELDRKVAVKLLRTDPRAKGSKERLVREARAVARIAHPNVVVVHDVGEHEGSVFMAMEFVEGGTLGTWVKDDERTPEAILGVFLDAGRGLEAAHAAGIVHRDFKPMNVLMGHDARPRVTDFGLASGEAPSRTELEMSIEQDISTATLTRTGMLVGTPAYMAPEQFERASVDARSDQFSFCVALFEALCGARPFAGKTMSELAVNVQAGRIAEPGRMNALPRRVRAALERGLRADPEERFGNMSALLAALTPGHTGRRRGAAMLTVGALVGLVGVAYGVSAATPVPPVAGCEHDQPPLWGPERRARLETGLGGDAAKAWQTTELPRVLTSLDQEARALEGAHETICAADPSVAQGRCLLSVRERFDTLSTALELGGPNALERAMAAVQQLPVPSTCTSDPQALPLASRGPADSAWRPYGLASSLLDVGAYDRAAAEAQTALGEAAVHGDLALQARAAVVLGRALVELGRFDEAEETLETGFSAAWAAHDDTAALELAAQLIMLVGQQQGREDAAQVWLDLGAAAAERLEGPTIEAAALWEAAGVLAKSRNAWEDATGYHERALAIRRELLPPEHPDVVSSLHHLSGIDYEAGEVSRGLERSREVLKRRLETLGPDHPDVAPARNLLAVGLIHAGEYDEAAEQLERSLQLGIRVHGELHPGLASTRSNLAVVLNRKGQHARAMEIYEQVLRTWSEARGEDDPSVALAHYNLGATARRAGRYEVAREHGERALAVWEAQLGAEHPRMASGHAGLAGALTDLGECEAALDHAQRAVAIIEDLPPNPRGVKSYYALSAAHRCLGDLPAALVASDTSLEQGSAMLGEDNPMLTGMYAHAADLQRLTGDLERARATAEQALDTAITDAEKAGARFALAQALVSTDRNRARELAQAAASELPEGPAHAKKRSALSVFLAEVEG